MTPYQIKYARAAIVAKAAYWDALRAFEVVTTDGRYEWSAHANDKACETIDHLVVCAGDTAEDNECLTDDDISSLFSFLCKDE